MAVFKKIFSKNKTKSPAVLKIEGEASARLASAELERQKKDWQEELDQMSDFLLLKTVKEQQEEGVERPVDTCYIADQDGMPVLRSVFDTHHFQPTDINLRVEEYELIVEAKRTDEHDDREFTKTLIRRVQLPPHVDPLMMNARLDSAGMLVIDMPFHLPPQKRPQGPNVFPIVHDAAGRRKIRLVTEIGNDFTREDVNVERNGHALTVTAVYNEKIGKYGRQAHERQVKREYMLPKNLHIEGVRSCLSPDGKLYIDIMLEDAPPYKCQIYSEQQEND